MNQQNTTESHCLSSHPVFVVDDTFFRSRTPTTPHWSIAWSDLMMTMFVLFLTLFVYQLAHREFLGKEKEEVVGGMPLNMPLPPSATLPFYPIYPEIAKNGSRVLRPVEDMPRNDSTTGGPSPSQPAGTTETMTAQYAPFEKSMTVAPVADPESDPRPLSDQDRPTIDKGTMIQPAATDTADNGRQLIAKIFDLSRTTLAREKLEKFASVELIPDKAMRIILTGDLLFDSGHAELTVDAQRSLRKLLPIIRQTPYMINVVGHTDSVPMSSPRYPTNWELSTARACQVARFLMDEAGIPGSQLVVSGYSYFRPVRPNTSASNRRANRRVEIILSRQPAPAKRVILKNTGDATAIGIDVFSWQTEK